jgi:chaperone modulatory protein CbpM
MNKEEMISIAEFCKIYQIDLSLLNALNESGAIVLEHIEEELYLHYDHLNHLNKIICFYEELGINIEGIEAILHLLNQIEQLQNTIKHLNNTTGH